MTYELRLLPVALTEWETLGAPIKSQFKNKLAERLGNPNVPADKLRGYDSVYKIKLRAAGYRLAAGAGRRRPAGYVGGVNTQQLIF